MLFPVPWAIYSFKKEYLRILKLEHTLEIMQVHLPYSVVEKLRLQEAKLLQ